MLELNHINKAFKNKRVLVDINLTLPDTGFIAIAGESGGGKSTLINIISGIEAPDSGEILLNGENIFYRSENERINKRLSQVAYMAQKQILLQNKTVYENLKEVLDIYHHEEEEIIKVLKKVHLDEKYKNRMVSTLSTGEAQRVCIAIALLKKADILVLDEATENLDIENRRFIMRILKEISKSKLVLLVTHDVGTAQDYVERLITISDREIYSDEVFEPKEVEFTEEEIEEERIESKKQKRLPISLYNLMFYLLFPVVILFLTAMISVEIKPKIDTEHIYPKSHYTIKDNPSNLLQFTEEDVLRIFEDDSTFLIFNFNKLYNDKVDKFYDYFNGYLDYDVNYELKHQITSSDEFVVSTAWVELNPGYATANEMNVIEIIKNESPVLIMNWDIIIGMMDLENYTIYDYYEYGYFSSNSLITSDMEQTNQLGIPLENCMKLQIQRYYKSNRIELNFGISMCCLAIFLTILLYYIFAYKQAPSYHNTIAFYRLCGLNKLKIRRKLIMQLYLLPMGFILLFSGIVHLIMSSRLKEVRHQMEFLRFTASTYWVSFLASCILLILLNEVSNCIIFGKKLKRMIKAK